MKPSISTLQMVAIINNTIAPTAILTVPGVAIGYASTDAWISVSIAGIVGVLIALMIAAVCKCNPGKPFIEWMENRFGRPAGILIGILFGIYYFNTFCTIVRQFANFISDMVLDMTPLYILVGIMVAVAAFTVMHGVEAIARSAAIVLLLVIIVMPISVTLNYDDINLKRLLPLFDAGPLRIATAALSPIGWLSEVSILLIFAPYLKRSNAVARAGVIGSAISSGQILLVIVLAITIFGPRIVRLMSYTFINMIGIVELGEFVERIEIFTVSVWGMTMYIKMAVFLYAALHCLTYTLRLRSSRHALAGLSLLAVVTAVAAWPRNSEFSYLAAMETLPFLLFFNVVLPVLIGVGLIVTRGNESGKGAQSP